MTSKASAAARGETRLKPSFELGFHTFLRDGLLDEKYFVQNIAFFLICDSMQDARPALIAGEALESV